MCRVFSNVNRFLFALIFLFAACAPLDTGVQAAEKGKPNVVLRLDIADHGQGNVGGLLQSHAIY